MWLVIAIVSQLALTAALMQIPSIRDAFGVLKPSVSELGGIFGFGVVVFISMEIIKAVIRSKMAKATARWAPE
jgi:hypothetical protein